MTTAEMERDNRIAEARQSFSGKSLTDSQFAESWSLAGVMARNIRASGSFHEKLTDYAHAFARSEKFDAVKGETIIRDIFKARYGVTMNQMREGFVEREAEVRDSAREQALVHARDIEALISQGETMPFYRAYDRASGKLAETFGITQAAAKTMMKDAYREIEGRELYETGKALEDQHHRPKVEAEQARREEARERPRARSR
ncbi:MAG TPA: hypothetical protein PKA13_21965 [Geminicoccaceae bacterium]|nr:hypothetical protein [Geminicoccaceae bacterium]